MSDDELAQIRALAESVFERARNDEAYLEQLRDDPAATLQAAGIAADAANQIGADELQPEVTGFKPKDCTFTCDRYSCIITKCGYVPLSN